MEINITNLMQEFDYMQAYSPIVGSVYLLGENAALITWNNALKYAEEKSLLKTDKEIQEAKDYFSGFGAWSESEINNWTPLEVNALLLQEIAHQMDEKSNFDTWEEYREAQEEGIVSGNIFKNDNNEFYFYMGY